MTKKLKEFVEENRRAFDDETPSEMNWSKIEQTISQKRKFPFLKSRIYKWSAAAAVFFIMAAGSYYILMKKTDPRSTPPQAKTVRPSGNSNDLNGLTPEYAARVQQINAAIDAKQEELKSVAADQPKLYDQFAGDLAALDSAFRVLKNQAQHTPNQEVIIKAMLQNLQLQAELLSKQLQIVHELKNNKPDNHEKESYRSL